MRTRSPYRFFYRDEFYPVGANIDHLRLSPGQCVGLEDLANEANDVCHHHAHILQQDDRQRTQDYGPATTPNLTDEERSWCHDRIDQAQQRLEDIRAIQRSGLTGIILSESRDNWPAICTVLHHHRRRVDLFNQAPIGRDEDMVARFMIAHQHWDKSGGWSHLRRADEGQQAGLDMARLIRVIDAFYPAARQNLLHNHSRIADEARHYAERLMSLGTLAQDYPLHPGSPYLAILQEQEKDTGEEGDKGTSSGGNRFRGTMESLRLDMDMRENSELPSSFLDNPVEAKRYVMALRYDEFVARLKPNNPAPISEVKPEDVLKADAILKVRQPFLAPKMVEWWKRKPTPDG